MHRIPCAKGEQAWKAVRGKVVKHSFVMVKTKAVWPCSFHLYKYTLMVCSVPHLSPVSAS